MNFETQVQRILVLTVLLLAPISVAAQQIDRDKIVAQFGKEKCVQVDERKLKFCRFDYVAGGWRVDAIATA